MFLNSCNYILLYILQGDAINGCYFLTGNHRIFEVVGSNIYELMVDIDFLRDNEIYHVYAHYSDFTYRLGFRFGGFSGNVSRELLFCVYFGSLNFICNAVCASG